MKNCRVALVQAAPVIFDTEATLDRIEQHVADASGRGAELVMFPEAYLSGYMSALDWGWPGSGIRENKGNEDFARFYWASAIEVPGPAIERLATIAATHRVHLAVGAIERDGGTLYCAFLLFNTAGVLLGHRRKLMPTGAERLVWGQGDGSTLHVHATDLGRLGAVICWENLMPPVRMAMYQQGIEIYLAPNADDDETWLATATHIAREGGCFVLACNQFNRRRDFPDDYTGFPDDDPEFIVSHGGSCIISPLGEYLAGPVRDREEILITDLDHSDIARAKHWFDGTGHYSRPDLFHLEVNRRRQEQVSFIDEGDSN